MYPAAIVAKLHQHVEATLKLNVFAGRAGIVTWRQEIDIDRAPAADWTRPLLMGEVDNGGHVAGLLQHPRFL
jgi:hypothetical protein